MYGGHRASVQYEEQWHEGFVAVGYCSTVCRIIHLVLAQPERLCTLLLHQAYCYLTHAAVCSSFKDLSSLGQAAESTSCSCKSDCVPKVTAPTLICMLHIVETPNAALQLALRGCCLVWGSNSPSMVYMSLLDASMTCMKPLQLQHLVTC